MSAAIVLVQMILPLMPQIITGAEELWKFISVTRSAAQQSAEWTPALEAQYQAALKATANDPAYQPDGQ